MHKLDSRYALSAAYLVFCLLILIWVNSLISQKPIVSDAAQNLRMSYHLYTSGVLSNDSEGEESPSPTNYRESFPPIVNAVFMYLHPGIHKNAGLQSFVNGENAKRIKQVNFIWFLVLLIASGYLTYLVTKNRWLPFLVLFLLLVYFIRFGGHFNSLLTELPAASLMILTSLFLVLAVRKETRGLFVASGISMGLLILTKAVFFYLSVIVILLFLYVIPKRKLYSVSVFAAGLLLIVGPWLIRNYSIYKSFEVTQRAGAVLHLRATQNLMTNEEVVGAFYLWGPYVYKRLIDDTFLGADRGDFDMGGKYERISDEKFSIDTLAIEKGLPEKAITFYGKSRAEINRLRNLLGVDGEEGPRREAYDIMKSKSYELIFEHPIRHISMSVLFLWRGIWCFPNSTIPFLNDSIQIPIHNLINLISYLSLFVFFIVGLLKKENELLALTILPVSMLLIYGFMTQNISRFSEPAIPSMLICLSLLFYLVWQKINAKYLKKGMTRFKVTACFF